MKDTYLAISKNVPVAGNPMRNFIRMELSASGISYLTDTDGNILTTTGVDYCRVAKTSMVVRVAYLSTNVYVAETENSVYFVQVVYQV